MPLPPFTHAILRTPGSNFADGITTADLGRPDYALMLEQHGAYADVLRALGLKVDVLGPLPDFPDAYFVEDAAVLTAESAVVTRPGALARRGEEEALAHVLKKLRPLVRIEAPGTLDGGDVLIAGDVAFIGLSNRTNAEGAVQLGKVLEHEGFTWHTVPVAEGLHFKSSVNWVGEGHLLMTEAFAGRPEFKGFKPLVVHHDEEYACNTLWINGTLLTPKGFPKTRARLESLGLPIIELDTSEARKMDGGLTCLSLRF